MRLSYLLSKLVRHFIVGRRLTGTGNVHASRGAVVNPIALPIVYREIHHLVHEVGGCARYIVL